MKLKYIRNISLGILSQIHMHCDIHIHDDICRQHFSRHISQTECHSEIFVGHKSQYINTKYEHKNMFDFINMVFISLKNQ